MVSFPSPNRERNTYIGSKVSASIQKILVLIKGFINSNLGDQIHSNSMEQDTCRPHLCGDSSDTHGYIMCVLQWKNLELDTTVQSLANVCNNILHGKANIVEFVVWRSLKKVFGTYELQTEKFGRLKGSNQT